MNFDDRIALLTALVRRDTAERLCEAYRHTLVAVQARNEKLERRIMELEGKKTLNDCKRVD